MLKARRYGSGLRWLCYSKNEILLSHYSSFLDASHWRLVAASSPDYAQRHLDFLLDSLTLRDFCRRDICEAIIGVFALSAPERIAAPIKRLLTFVDAGHIKLEVACKRQPQLIADICLTGHQWLPALDPRVHKMEVKTIAEAMERKVLSGAADLSRISSIMKRRSIWMIHSSSVKAQGIFPPMPILSAVPLEERKKLILGLRVSTEIFRSYAPYLPFAEWRAWVDANVILDSVSNLIRDWMILSTFKPSLINAWLTQMMEATLTYRPRKGAMTRTVDLLSSVPVKVIRALDQDLVLQLFDLYSKSPEKDDGSCNGPLMQLAQKFFFCGRGDLGHLCLDLLFQSHHELPLPSQLHKATPSAYKEFLNALLKFDEPSERSFRFFWRLYERYRKREGMLNYVLSRQCMTVERTPFVIDRLVQILLVAKRTQDAADVLTAATELSCESLQNSLRACPEVFDKWVENKFQSGGRFIFSRDWRTASRYISEEQWRVINKTVIDMNDWNHTEHFCCLLSFSKGLRPEDSFLYKVVHEVITIPETHLYLRSHAHVAMAKHDDVRYLETLAAELKTDDDSRDLIYKANTVLPRLTPSRAQAILSKFKLGRVGTHKEWCRLQMKLQTSDALDTLKKVVVDEDVHEDVRSAAAWGLMQVLYDASVADALVKVCATTKARPLTRKIALLRPSVSPATMEGQIRILKACIETDDKETRDSACLQLVEGRALDLKHEVFDLLLNREDMDCQYVADVMVKDPTMLQRPGLLDTLRQPDKERILLNLVGDQRSGSLRTSALRLALSICGEQAHLQHSYITALVYLLETDTSAASTLKDYVNRSRGHAAAVAFVLQSLSNILKRKPEIARAMESTNHPILMQAAKMISGPKKTERQIPTSTEVPRVVRVAFNVG